MDGWLIIDKPRNISSNSALMQLKRLIGKKDKIGHAGTLDPLAQGVLPVAIGEATKTVQYLMDAQKEYEFTIKWGEERSTYDAEGEITAEGGCVPALEEIKNILGKFIGEIEQFPPIYSALKINGQPAYKLARKGEEVKLSSRKVTIDELNLLDHDKNLKITSFRVLCGKGTYVRSLAVDIARALDTYGYVSFLKRTKVGNFLISNAISLVNLTDLVHNDELISRLLPVTYGLGDILAVTVNEEQAKKLKSGMSIFAESHRQISEQIVQILWQGKLQAIAFLRDGLCKPIRVFNLN